MAEYKDSFLNLVHNLLTEAEAKCLDDHGTLLGDVAVAINLCFSFPAISHALHGDNRLGAACVMHLTKAADDYLAAFHLVTQSLHAQAANAARAAFETSCQCAWLHVERQHLDSWWNGGSPATTGTIREDLPWSDWRRFFYADLSEIAHPRRRSMEFLIVRSDTGARRATVILPPYDSAAVLHTIMAIECCIVTTFWDFEQLHEPLMTELQRGSWKNAIEPVKLHYENVVVPF